MRWKREPGLSRRRSPLWRIKASLNFLFLPSLSPVPPSLFLTFILMCSTSKQDSFGSSAFIFGMEQCTVFLFSSLIFLIKHLLLSLFSHSYWALTETVCLPFSFFFFFGNYSTITIWLWNNGGSVPGPPKLFSLSLSRSRSALGRVCCGWIGPCGHLWSPGSVIWLHRVPDYPASQHSKPVIQNVEANTKSSERKYLHCSTD